MPDPSTLRDSTQIVLPSNALEGLREDLNEQFTLTLYEMDVVIRDGSRTSAEGENADETATEDENRDETVTEDEGPDETTTEGPNETTTEDGNETTTTEDYVRIIGSPVEIKAASAFLSRHGVRLR